MKTKIISVLLTLLLSVSITGCAGRKNSLDSSNSSNASNTSSTNNTSNNKTSGTNTLTSTTSTSVGNTSANTNTQASSNNAVLDAYKAVVQNKAEFYSTDNKKNLYLNDFLTNKELYGTTFKVTHFAVLDMDGDKSPEVVLELSVGNEPQFFEVLHYTKGLVYGYLIVYRGLEELKADGTFRFSNSAADNGWGKLKFESNALKTDMLGYSKSSQSGDKLTISYFINDKPVTKEAFDTFNNEQSGKKGVTWYEFSQNNIETELSSK